MNRRLLAVFLLTSAFTGYVYGMKVTNSNTLLKKLCKTTKRTKIDVACIKGFSKNVFTPGNFDLDPTDGFALQAGKQEEFRQSEFSFAVDLFSDTHPFYVYPWFF